MKTHEFKFYNLSKPSATKLISKAGAEGFKLAGLSSDVAILTRSKRRAKPGKLGDGCESAAAHKAYEFVFFSLHEIGAADDINKAGSEGYQIVATAIDVVIMSRRRQEVVKEC